MERIKNGVDTIEIIDKGNNVKLAGTPNSNIKGKMATESMGNDITSKKRKKT